jgi:hypothetical protein
VLLVALLALGPGKTVDVEAPLLAGDLGVAAYDARLLIAGGFPALVLTTPARDRALALVGALRGRGHDAAACDAATIAPSTTMIAMRRFRFEGDAIVLDDGARLPYADILCLLTAWHTQRTDAETKTESRAFDAGRAIASGGLLLTKKVTTRTTAKVEAREQVLYLFRRSGETPWILRTTSASYAGLGERLAASQAENFTATVGRLRELAPGATYDGRLLTVKRVPERTGLHVSGSTTTVATSTEAGVDVLAHFIAQALGTKR